MAKAAVIFDVGFVIFSPSAAWQEALQKRFGLTRHDLGLLLNGAESRQAGTRFSTTEVAADIVRELGSRLGARTERAARQIVAGYLEPEQVTYSDQLLELTRDLGRAQIRVGLLSNAPADFETGNLAPIYERGHVDADVISGRDGVAKPSEAAFELLLSRLGAKASEACFVDDVPSHAEAARALGMSSFVYEGDAGAVRSWLRAEGLPL